MILDSLTIKVLAAELANRHVGCHIRNAHADDTGLDLLLASAPGGETDDTWGIRLEYGPPGTLSLVPAPTLADGGGRERYLQGSRIDSIVAVPGDRVLSLCLSRPDAESRLTHGLLHILLIPPRYRAVLVSRSHGRILGVWAGRGDRRAPAYGSPYQAPVMAERLDPVRHTEAEFADTLQRHGGALEQALQQALAGADRHLISRLCADSEIDPGAAVADLADGDIATLRRMAQQLWSRAAGPVYRWTRGPIRVSVAAPAEKDIHTVRFATVSSALEPAAEEATIVPIGSTPGHRRRLEKVLRVLQRRGTGLQKDLDEADDADALERRGNSLMAAAAAIETGGNGSIPDVHDARGSAMIDIRLAPGETSAQHAARLLRRSAKLRRRAHVLPPRLHRVRELIFETEGLLEGLRQGDEISEETMARWERRVEVRQTPPRDGKGDGPPEDDRQGARPRRYLTSDGWSVWAGRNNRENDILSHRLATQNDVWFHAHGYAGSHVILRREGRKEDPSSRALEEAAGVAAYWSKGRTANKVPVVYTLAKFVSKPRGAVPGLAVMKREKTIMVRPALLPAEEGEKD